jgi:hypothetical protein
MPVFWQGFESVSSMFPARFSTPFALQSVFRSGRKPSLQDETYDAKVGMSVDRQSLRRLDYKLFFWRGRSFWFEWRDKDYDHSQLM